MADAARQSTEILIYLNNNNNKRAVLCRKTLLELTVVGSWSCLLMS